MFAYLHGRAGLVYLWRHQQPCRLYNLHAETWRFPLARSSSPSRATRQRSERPTLAEVRAWPATVSVEQGARAFGVSRAHAYELARKGDFPAKTLKVGRRTVVLTASILHAIDPEAA